MTGPAVTHVVLRERDTHGEAGQRVTLPAAVAADLIARGRAERIVTVLLDCPYTNHNRGERVGLPEREARRLIALEWAEELIWPPPAEPEPEAKDFPSPADKMIRGSPITKAGHNREVEP